MEVKYKEQAIEAFNTVRTNIGFLGIDRAVKTILVTSSIKDEGKSIVAANIASSFVAVEKKTIIVDCDMRNPTVHRTIGVVNRKGLSDLLMDERAEEKLDEYIIQYKPNFHVLTAGHRPPNPAEMLSSKKMSALLEALNAKYDRIILDTPPVLVVTDALTLSKQVDAIILVVRYGYTTKDALRQTQKAMEIGGVKPTACIFNGIPHMEKRYSYYGYYDYQGTKEETAKKGKATGEKRPVQQPSSKHAKTRPVKQAAAPTERQHVPERKKIDSGERQ